jgi:hypothetical protein
MFGGVGVAFVDANTTKTARTASIADLHPAQIP